MLVIRLSRVGKKKQPSFRIVVQDKRKDPWGKAHEIVGFYNPRSKPKTIDLKADRIKFWIEKGAQPSPTLHNMLIDAKVIEGEKMKTTTGDKDKSKTKAEVKPGEAGSGSAGKEAAA